MPRRTERLLIRPYTPADLPAVAGIVTDPQVFWWLPRPLTDQEALRWLTEEIAEVTATGSGTYAVVRAADGVVIGGVALKPRQLADESVVELGYHLGRSWWSNGYATEAGAALLAEAGERGVDRVAAFILPENRRSRGVAVRLGMQRQRSIVWAGLPHDLWAIQLTAAGASPSAPCYDN